MPADIFGPDEIVQDQRFDYANINDLDRPIYIGSASPGSSTNAPVWAIQFLTWEIGPAGSLVPSIIRTRIGAWDNRATLF